MRAPRRRACSRSSSTQTAAPSATGRAAPPGAGGRVARASEVERVEGCVGAAGERDLPFAAGDGEPGLAERLRAGDPVAGEGVVGAVRRQLDADVRADHVRQVDQQPERIQSAQQAAGEEGQIVDGALRRCRVEGAERARELRALQVGGAAAEHDRPVVARVSPRRARHRPPPAPRRRPRAGSCGRSASAPWAGGSAAAPRSRRSSPAAGRGRRSPPGSPRPRRRRGGSGSPPSSRRGWSPGRRR